MSTNPSERPEGRPGPRGPVPGCDARGRAAHFCKCAGHKAARNAYQRWWYHHRRVAADLVGFEHGEGPHGSLRRYQQGCRCVSCKRARNAYQRDWRLRHRDDLPHGLKRYRLGCRCSTCRLASSEHERARYRATRGDRYVDALNPKFPHGKPMGYRRGCRCDRCSAAITQEQEMRRRIEVHGTRNTYQVWGCRCDVCRVANTRYKQIQQHAKQLAQQTGVRHGTEKQYGAGCRCELCVESHRILGVHPQRVTTAPKKENVFIPRPNQHPLKAILFTPTKRAPTESWWTEQDRDRFRQRLEQEQARLKGYAPDLDDMGVTAPREVRFA